MIMCPQTKSIAMQRPRGTGMTAKRMTKMGLAALICAWPVGVAADPVTRWTSNSRVAPNVIENGVSSVLQPLQPQPRSQVSPSSSRMAHRRSASPADGNNLATNWTGFQSQQNAPAIKAFVVVTSPDIGVDRITLPQLVEIYSGKVTNWRQIGGADLLITPIQAATGSALHHDIRTLIPTPRGTPAVFSMADADAILTGLNTFSGGISLVPSHLAASANRLAIVDACGVAHRATDFAVRAGDYPLAQLDFHGTSPARLLSRPQNATNWRIVNARSGNLPPSQEQSASALGKFLTNAQQLSAVFSGGNLSRTEGVWTRAHFIRLRDTILSGALDGQDIHFVGFATNANELTTRRGAQRAAHSILVAFKAFAPQAAMHTGITLTASGYAQLGETACQHNGAAVPRDTRVEVWARPAGS